MLSRRQLQVLEDAMRGYTAEETGRRQFIATATVKAHRTNLMRVLGATSMTQAVAIYLGWEDTDELATVTPLWDLASDGTEAGARRAHPAGSRLEDHRLAEEIRHEMAADQDTGGPLW